MKVLFFILAVLFIVFFSCSDNPTGPYSNWELYKHFDGPVQPPSRPPLPCGWYVINDSTWGYDVHADTCN